MKEHKQIKNLTREDIRNICEYFDKCEKCVLRDVCAVTADPIELFEKYNKHHKTIDYRLEETIYIWRK